MENTARSGPPGPFEAAIIAALEQSYWTIDDDCRDGGWFGPCWNSPHTGRKVHVDEAVVEQLQHERRPSR
jgi:hypothetical protein